MAYEVWTDQVLSILLYADTDLRQPNLVQQLILGFSVVSGSLW